MADAAEEKRERRRRQRQNVVSCCKKFITFLFSHIGLAGLVVGYSILGGFLFQWLEAPVEETVRTQMTERKVLCVNQILTATQNFANNLINESEFNSRLAGSLAAFQTEIVLAVKEKGWDGTDDSSTTIQWSFAGALLYAVTVITTIGKLHEQRHACILKSKLNFMHPIAFPVQNSP
jgi:hypothetical protein